MSYVPSCDKKVLQYLLDSYWYTLEAGLSRLSCGHMRTYCSFAHVLNLFWMPLIEYMDSCTSEPAPVWTKNLALNHTALLAEMAGTVMGADEPLEMDKWIDFIKDTLCRLLKIDVPSRFICDSRPETDLNFLKLLEGKEHPLHRMATKDLEQRSLGADARAAILNLGDIKSRIRRRVLQEILEKCMFLHYWTGKHPTVTCDTTWDQLMQKAVNLILSLEITTSPGEVQAE
jgi:hypothetical protein